MCTVRGCIAVLKAHTSWQIICLGCWNNTWEIANATIMRKWKWLLVNGCECKSLISTVTEFLKSWNKCFVMLSSMLKNDDISVEYMSYIHCCNDFLFNFCDEGNLTDWTVHIILILTNILDGVCKSPVSVIQDIHFPATCNIHCSCKLGSTILNFWGFWNELMLAVLCHRYWRREWTTCGGLSCRWS